MARKPHKKYRCPRPVNRLLTHRMAPLNGPFFQNTGRHCIHTQGNAYAPGGPLSGPRAVALVAVPPSTLDVAFSACVSIPGAASNPAGVEYQINGGGWTQVPSMSGGPTAWGTDISPATFTDGDFIEWRYVGGSDGIVDCDGGDDIGDQHLSYVVPVTPITPILERDFTTLPLPLGDATFTRPSGDYAYGVGGFYAQYGADEPLPVFDASGTQLGLLKNPALTNHIHYSYDLTQWTQQGGSSPSAIAAAETGIDGVLGHATQLTDDSAVEQDFVKETLTYNADIAIRFWMKKETIGAEAETRIADVFTGGTPKSYIIDINKETGIITASGDTANGSYTSSAETINGEDWWKVTLQHTDSGANTTHAVSFRPGGGDTSGLGTCIIGGVESYIGITEVWEVHNSSPIVSNGAAVSRASAVGPSWPKTQNCDDAMIVFEALPPFPSTSSAEVGLATFNSATLSQGALYMSTDSGQIISHDGTAARVYSGITYSTHDPVTFGYRTNSPALQVELSAKVGGVWGSSGGLVYDGSPQDTNIIALMSQADYPMICQKVYVWDSDQGQDWIEANY